MKKQVQSKISLPEVHSTVEVPSKKKFWRTMFAFFGPAYLVSIGYMDPGNWATDIAGGSRYGYTLLWVLLMSNMMALLLQSLSARLGIVTGRDLAQASRENYAPVINFFLYILAEIAIAACDLAEVLGMAIGLQLLFGLPLTIGVALTVLDTFLLLMLQHYGMRKLEAFVFAMIAMIGVAFLIEMCFAHPDISGIVNGIVPRIPDNTALYIAIGIIGATVMPHNLYLHSSLVQTRKFNKDNEGISKAIRYNFLDSAVALNMALFVNAAILILAASTFYKNGMFHVAEIKDAHRFLSPLLGTQWAPVLFAVALIAAGQSSTVTGTLAGQIVMEGYLNVRMQPWLRRLITRLVAIVPALLTIIFMGEGATGKMLILSQVILSLQLGFAIVPLIHFVSNKKKMGSFVIKKYVRIMAWLCAAIIVSLNVKLVTEQLSEWLAGAGEYAPLLRFTVIPLAVLIGLLLLYITFAPLIKKYRAKTKVPHGMVQDISGLKHTSYKRIAVSLDFTDIDSTTIAHAVSQGGKEAEYLLLHIVETAGAMFFGHEIVDFESESDEKNLEEYVRQLSEQGYKVSGKLGYGTPKKQIPEIVNTFKAELLVMGAHGHKALKDILLGTTVETVRHRVKIHVLIVRK